MRLHDIKASSLRTVVFYEGFAATLQNKVNTWLEENPELRIADMMFNATDRGLSVMIVHYPKKW